MLFPSPEFLFFFLPLVFLLTLFFSLRVQNVLLLFASILFYALTDLTHLPLFLFVLLFTYATGFLLQGKHCKGFLFFSVLTLLSVLIFYKYLPSLADIFPSLLAFLPRVSLPVGISFYTFQAISYLVDVYRREVTPEKSPVAFMTYLALFPQLIAGPIVRYSDVEGALKSRCPERERGIYRFLTGLFKKVLIADTLSEFFLLSQTLSGGGIYVFFGLLAASFQIYFDFSGYSDMAIGLGLLFGFSFPENFDYPYTAKSAVDFWKRWHITLSSFFKSYVYIPLGGNRRGKRRTLLHLLIVWGLTGLWHGASLNFLFWGLFWFVFLALEKFTPLSRYLERLPGFLQHGYALSLILFSWLLFSFPDGNAGLLYLSRMISSPPLTQLGAYEILRYLPIFLLAGIFSTPMPRRLYEKWAARSPKASAVLLSSTFLLTLSFLFYHTYSPFLYFRF